MLDLLLSISLVLCALAWAWFGVESLRRRTLTPTRPETARAPISTRSSLLAAGLCAALGVFLIDRSGSGSLQRGVQANEPLPALAPSDFVYSGTMAPPWWAAFPQGIPLEELDMTQQFPLEGAHADGLDWKPIGN